jgi:PTH1 family peptidyl-tRNA hydrolase
VGRGDDRRDLADHVLATFEPHERPVLDDAVARAADAVEVFITDGIGAMMNRFNRREDTEAEKETENNAGKEQKQEDGS